jgi:hypothetical protein
VGKKKERQGGKKGVKDGEGLVREKDRKRGKGGLGSVPEMRASLWLARKKFLGQCLQGNFGRYRCAAEIAKTSQCIYCYLMRPGFTCYNLFDNLDTIG